MTNWLTGLPGNDLFGGETSATCRCFGSCCFKQSTPAASNHRSISLSWTRDFFLGDYCPSDDIFRRFSFYIQRDRYIFHDMNWRGGGGSLKQRFALRLPQLALKESWKISFCMQYRVMCNFWHFFPSAGFYLPIVNSPPASLSLGSAAVQPSYCIDVGLFLITLASNRGTLKQHHVKACWVD